jgi:hypothetical protein
LWYEVSLDQSEKSVCCYCGAFDKAYSLQARQSAQLQNGVIGELHTASQVNVAQSTAVLDEKLQCSVCYIAAVSQMQEMNVLAETSNLYSPSIRDMRALCKNQRTQLGSRCDDVINALIRDAHTTCNIEDAKILISVTPEISKAFVTYLSAHAQSELPQLGTGF